MTPLLRQFGRLRLAAAILVLAPLLVLPLLGFVWMWEHEMMLFWLLGMVTLGGTGYLLHAFARWRDQRKENRDETRANPNWPGSADAPWQAVQEKAASISIAQWPLSDGGKLWQLGRETLEMVAQLYHPERKQPLLEMTVPHALLIIERASREFREEISHNIPLSHQLTIGDLVRAHTWKEYAEKLETAYRLGRAVIDPTSVLFSEFRREMGNRIFGYGADKVQQWMLQEYVRKVGYYAIELYSGRLLLDDAPPTSTPVKANIADKRTADENATRIASVEPLRIVVLGCANAGKSSLINALFGSLAAPADMMPGTTRSIIPYKLRRDDQDMALIFDTPGCDTPELAEKDLRGAVINADLLLWVTAANRPDRQEEKAVLQQVRAWLAELPNRRPPPLLLVVSHIDRLRPVREWQPPYDLANPVAEKARNIAGAACAASSDLGVQMSNVIPACLGEGRQYNVDDALWAAILSLEEEAGRVRFLRCMEARQREENWELIRKQVVNAGRLLLEVPRLFKRP